MRRVGIRLLDPGALLERVGGWQSQRLAQQASQIDALRADMETQALACITQEPQQVEAESVPPIATVKLETPLATNSLIFSYPVSDEGHVQPRTAALYTRPTVAEGENDTPRLVRGADVDLFHAILRGVSATSRVPYENLSDQIKNIALVVLGGLSLPELKNTPNAAIIGRGIDLFLDRLQLSNPPLHDTLMATRDQKVGK